MHLLIVDVCAGLLNILNIEENVMNLSVSVNLVHNDHLHGIADLRLSTNMNVDEVLNELSLEFIKELNTVNTLVSDIPEPLIPVMLALHGSQNEFNNLENTNACFCAVPFV